MSAMADIDAGLTHAPDQPLPTKTKAQAAPLSPEAELEYHRALLKQIRAVYTNPELDRICSAALKGDWKHVFYDKYKPEGLLKKT